MRVRKYNDFILEEGLLDIFKKEKAPIKKNKVDDCIDHIILFLKDNQIDDWNDFESMKPTDRHIIDKLIDSDVDNMEELKEVRFGIRLHLSDTQQLRKMIHEYEDTEDYEKCSKILKKIKNIQ